ncbi:MAG: hypothetical protein LBR26_16130 [Prevotella sp.]|jgi:hypothetical protein|nr:hypothetical protein [Prevotella sp.]
MKKNIHIIRFLILVFVLCSTISVFSETDNTKNSNQVNQQNNSPDCYWSFVEQKVLTFEDSSKMITPTGVCRGFNYEEWLKINPRTLFTNAITYAYDIHELSKAHISPADFIVVPLYWTLIINDNHIRDGFLGSDIEPDIPEVSKAYIVLVINKRDGIKKILTLRVGDQFITMVPRVVNKKVSLSSVLTVNPNTDMKTQIYEYLQSVNFGPNNWGLYRCVSLRVFISKDRTIKHDIFFMKTKDEIYPTISLEKKGTTKRCSLM